MTENKTKIKSRWRTLCALPFLALFSLMALASPAAAQIPSRTADTSNYTASDAWNHAMNVVNALLDTIWAWLPVIMPLLLLVGLAFGLVMIVRSRMPG